MVYMNLLLGLYDLLCSGFRFDALRLSVAPGSHTFESTSNVPFSPMWETFEPVLYKAVRCDKDKTIVVNLATPLAYQDKSTH